MGSTHNLLLNLSTHQMRCNHYNQSTNAVQFLLTRYIKCGSKRRILSIDADGGVRDRHHRILIRLQDISRMTLGKTSQSLVMDHCLLRHPNDNFFSLFGAGGAQLHFETEHGQRTEVLEALIGRMEQVDSRQIDFERIRREIMAVRPNHIADIRFELAHRHFTCRDDSYRSRRIQNVNQQVRVRVASKSARPQAQMHDYNETLDILTREIEMNANAREREEQNDQDKLSELQSQVETLTFKVEAIAELLPDRDKTALFNRNEDEKVQNKHTQRQFQYCDHAACVSPFHRQRSNKSAVQKYNHESSRPEILRMRLT